MDRSYTVQAEILGFILMLSDRFSFSLLFARQVGASGHTDLVSVLLLKGLDLECRFFDEIAWQLHQFWASVEFYSISWYCISLLVLGVFQVKTFCCVFLAEFWCS